MGPRSDQPRGVQYATSSANRGDLELDEPFRGGHVAVESGDDQPYREAMFQRQRLAVHADGEQRVPVCR